MKKLIWHSLNKRWLQSLSVLLAVAGSTAVLFALFLIYYGVTEGLATSKARMGADLLVIPAQAESLLDDNDLLFNGAPAVIYMDKGYEEKMARIDGVERVTPQFFGQTLNSSCCSATGEVRLIGFDASSDWVVRPWMNQVLNRDLAKDEIIVGSNVKGFDTDAPKILGHTVKVAATLQATGTSMDQSILMNIDTVRSFSQTTAGYGHFWGKYGEPDQLISALLVQVEEGKEKTVINAISQWGGLKTIQSNNVLKAIQGQMHTLFMVMLGGGLLMLFTSFLQFFARYLTMVWDRKSELGLYKALGATQRDLQKLIIGEAGVLTGGGLLAGFGLGAFGYTLILKLLQAKSSFPFIEPHGIAAALAVLWISILFGVIALIAVSIPLRQLGKIDPSLAMQRGDID